MIRTNSRMAPICAVLGLAVVLLNLPGCALITSALVGRTDSSTVGAENQDSTNDEVGTGGGFAGYSQRVSYSAWASQSGLAALPAGIATPLEVAPSAALPATAASSAAGALSQRWELFRSPGKPLTQYDYVRIDERDAVQAMAQGSGGLLRQRFRVEPQHLGQLRFSWKVPQINTAARVGQPDIDEAPLRVVMAFEGDRSKLSTRTQLISELSRLLVGEELPYATLAYVWSNVDAPGTVVSNARTDRIRSIVLESGEQRLNQWLAYERDIRADFMQAFGEPPGALISIALLTDKDSKEGSPIRAWYGPVQLKLPQAQAQAR